MENGSWKANVEITPNCPRCGSSNTKFCYYNNYSLTQPRYFCKGCRRYWTKGGSLRNVPVGGGCRKNRRGNKTLRQSFEGLTFKNSSPPCDISTTENNPIGHSTSYDPRRTNFQSSSSSVVTDGSPNIDLALVYANFLNQKPDDSGDNNNTIPKQILQAPFDPSLENSRRVSNTPSTLNLPEELGLMRCLDLAEQASTESHHFISDDQVYCSEFRSMTLEKEECGNNIGMNFELPPLPGEEEAQHDVMWSNSDMMINNHPFQPPAVPLLGPQIHDADLLIGNWCPFDLPRDASFSRP